MAEEEKGTLVYTMSKKRHLFIIHIHLFITNILVITNIYSLYLKLTGPHPYERTCAVIQTIVSANSAQPHIAKKIQPN